MTARARDLAIAALAVAQHGVVSLEQLVALGLSPRAVQHRCECGRLHRVHQGVYSGVPLALLSREGRWMAAVLACGPGALLSHRSAAALHGLRPYGGRLIDVAVGGDARRRRPGIRSHRSITLGAHDAANVRGIPCTTVSRTLLDLAGVLDLRAVERTCDEAEILETFDLTALTDQIARNPRTRGARNLQTVLETHYIGTTPTWTKIEEHFLALVRAAGLPAPTVNDWIDPGDGEPPMRVDFVWRAQRIAMETDSRKIHMTQQAFENDRRRDQRLTAARWRPLRSTWRQILFAPRQLELTLLRVFSLPA